MKLFFEIVDENPDFSQTEIALYFFMLNLNNRLAWREWFTVALSEALGGARLCENTYYKSINRLETLNLIERRKGHKNKAPQLKIVILKAAKFAVDGAVNGAVDGAVNGAVIHRQIDKIDYLYTARIFYEAEIKKAKQYQKENPFQEPEIRNSQITGYETLIRFIQGENTLKKPLHGILSIPGQLTFIQYQKISEYQGLRETLGCVNNDEKYYRGKKDLYPVLYKWLTTSGNQTRPP